MNSPINPNENKPGNPLFQERIKSASMARRVLPYRPLPSAETPGLLSRLLGQEAATTDRVIYVHIPFCKSLCPFCIYSKQIAESGETMKAYSKTLVKQIQSVSATVWSQSAPFEAVFFGGGTPTALSAGQLTAIVRSIKKHYPLTPDCEITVESTISEITPELCAELKEAGVNRISLGVQSFNTEIRKSLGRKASTEDIQKALHTLKESGFSNIAIDLIYMLEGQTMETWRNDLQLLAGSPITGCSVYPLIANPGSITTKPIENTEHEYNYFIEADNFLPGLKGWERFTPVQYGHEKKGTAKYVTSHGQNSDLLAFGAGSGGRIQNKMYLQSNKLNDFIANGNDFVHAPMFAMQIDPLFLKLRKIFPLSEAMYLAKTDFEELRDCFGEDVSGLIASGLIEQQETHYSLTETGRFWAGNISTLFSGQIAKLIKGQQ
jgi:anaerobilin synthase